MNNSSKEQRTHVSGDISLKDFYLEKYDGFLEPNVSLLMYMHYSFHAAGIAATS